ncbi:MAG: penicillin-binding protein activator, partial [Serratia symbiotica]|nr:penicillin-binding protein activator [Serratia symbiotica]
RASFGDRVAKAFNQEWQKLGGQRVLQQGIGSADELRKAANSGGLCLTGMPIPSIPTPPNVTIAGETPPVSSSDEPRG